MGMMVLSGWTMNSLRSARQSGGQSTVRQLTHCLPVADRIRIDAIVVVPCSLIRRRTTRLCRRQRATAALAKQFSARRKSAVTLGKSVGEDEIHIRKHRMR